MCEWYLLVPFLVLTNFCLLSDFFIEFLFRWPVSFWATIVNCNLQHRKSIEKTFYREFTSGLWIESSMCWPLHLRTYLDPKDAYFRWVAFAGGYFFCVCHDYRLLVIWFFLVLFHWLVSFSSRCVKSNLQHWSKMIEKGFLARFELGFLNSEFKLLASKPQNLLGF